MGKSNVYIFINSFMYNVLYFNLNYNRLIQQRPSPVYAPNGINTIQRTPNINQIESQYNPGIEQQMVS